MCLVVRILACTNILYELKYTDLIISTYLIDYIGLSVGTVEKLYV